MLFAILILSVGFVAFTNGANANFKGVASLYGSGTTSLRGALYWGTATTFAGSVAAIFLAEGLLKRFGGRDIVPDELAASPAFATAVAIGAAVTSFLATRFGFPVSTTHALVGALVGAGLAGTAVSNEASSVNITALGKSFIYPLLFSPLLAMVLGGLVYKLLMSLRLLPASRTRSLDVVHYLSSGAASFARGLNDTPKIVALLMVAPSVNVVWGSVGVAVMIAVGALVDAKNVAETLAKKVTDMNASQGFAASLVTAALVTTASFHSLPVSTTHVSVGSLTGIGVSTGNVHWPKVMEILMAWICTVPCGAVIGAIAFAALSVL